MKNLVRTLFVILTLCTTLTIVSFAQSNGTEIQTEVEIADRKKEVKELMVKHKADVAAIKKDSTLSKQQQQEQIIQLKKDMREEMGDRRRKGRYMKKEHREKTQAKREKLRNELKSIEDNDTLSHEEKEKQKAELLERGREEMKAAKAERRFRKKKSESYFKEKGKRGKLYKDGKVDEEKISQLSPEQKEKALKRLNERLAKLEKGYTKGDIEEATYKERKARIEDVIDQVNK